MLSLNATHGAVASTTRGAKNNLTELEIKGVVLGSEAKKKGILSKSHYRLCERLLPMLGSLRRMLLDVFIHSAEACFRNRQ